MMGREGQRKRGGREGGREVIYTFIIAVHLVQYL
jgi:hypothetical protein